jgi:hypothetical protein
LLPLPCCCAFAANVSTADAIIVKKNLFIMRCIKFEKFYCLDE